MHRERHLRAVAEREQVHTRRPEGFPQIGDVSGVLAGRVRSRVHALGTPGGDAGPDLRQHLGEQRRSALEGARPERAFANRAVEIGPGQAGPPLVQQDDVGHRAQALEELRVHRHLRHHRGRNSGSTHQEDDGIAGRRRRGLDPHHGQVDGVAAGPRVTRGHDQSTQFRRTLDAVEAANDVRLESETRRLLRPGGRAQDAEGHGGDDARTHGRPPSVRLSVHFRNAAAVSEVPGDPSERPTSSACRPAWSSRTW